MSDLLFKSKQSSELPLAWGTGSSFGQIASERQALKLINTCLECGIRRFDTGASYAMGQSEKMLGICLQRSHFDRSSLVISTKIGSLPASNFRQIVVKDYSPKASRLLIESSLVNLRTDYIDIVFFHSLPKEKEPIYRTLELLSGMKSSGQIRKIGVAAHSESELQWIINNSEAFDVVMSHFNPLAFEYTGHCLKELKNKGIFIYGSAPFASGLLVSKRHLLNLRSPVYSLFKISRNLKRSWGISSEKKLLIKKLKHDIYVGNLNLFDYTLTSDLVDISIVGSLSPSNVKKYCQRALMLA